MKNMIGEESLIMFNNIGKKIQGLCKVTFVINCIGSFGLAIVCADLLFKYEEILGIIGGLFIFLIGIFFSWLSQSVLFAYGKMAECSEEQCKLLKKLWKQSLPTEFNSNTPENLTACSQCGASLKENASFCGACGSPVRRSGQAPSASNVDTSIS